MNLSRFLEHWSVNENPFRAQEARHDQIFARLDIEKNCHPDFEKICGDLSRPSTSIVFGEKGSGKTAIRLQLQHEIEQHNRDNPADKVWMIAYDDLNPILDWFCGRLSVTTSSTDKAIDEALGRLRLVDHIDGFLHVATTNLVDKILGSDDTDTHSLGDAPDRLLRTADPHHKRDLMLLQALYDHDGPTAERARQVRKKIAAPKNSSAMWSGLAATMGWIMPAGLLTMMLWREEELHTTNPWMWALLALTGFWAILLFKHFVWNRARLSSVGRKVYRELRVPQRSRESLTTGLGLLPREDRDPAYLPVDDLEDRRYAMMERFRRVIRMFGYKGIVVVIDRVDEPTLVNGDGVRMRSIVWPMMRNKFLQQEGIGVKLLLPLELRGELIRESSNFFQEARLDKQSLVEQLSWTGAMLYDLCNARMKACLEASGQGEENSTLSLSDMFDEDVTREHVVDALDQMHQPRDAFKLIYECMHSHCSSFTEEQAKWRIPRLVLENARKQQAHRLQMFQRGFHPA